MAQKKKPAFTAELLDQLLDGEEKWPSVSRWTSEGRELGNRLGYQ